MLCYSLVFGKILTARYIFLHYCYLITKPCGKNGKTHYLNKTDVFLLYIMYIGMRMVNTERMLLGSDIVTKNQIKLKFSVAESGNRRYSIVLLSVSLCKYKGIGVTVTAPSNKYLISKLAKRLSVRAAKSDYRHRPRNDSRLNVFIARKLYICFNRRFCHCKGVATTLSMIVREDRTAHNRKIGIRAQEIMRILRHKIKQTLKGCALYLHGSMLL